MKSHRIALLFASSVAVLLVLILGALYLSDSAPAGAQPAFAGQSPKTGNGGDVCSTDWQAVQAPDPGPTYNTRLYTMSATSATDVWAVGAQFGEHDGTERGYAVHWNGATWSPIPVPSVGQYPRDALNSVVAISGSNVWAAGYSCGGSGAYLCTTLLMRWNGSAFSIVPGPNVPNESNGLYDIAAISANNIWAVGNASSCTNDACVTQPLTLHWNGDSWRIVATPNLGSQSAALTAVTSINSSDVWAVGNYVDSSGNNIGPISMHWNGTSWNLVVMPMPDGGNISVNGNAAISSHDVWAVGNYTDNVSGDVYTLIYHWNGTAWSIVPSPNHNDVWQNNYLNDISALASNDVWAVGYWADVGWDDPLLLHWDGTSWTMAQVPFTHDQDGLGGVVMISPTDSWAVGYAEHDIPGNTYDRPFIERYYTRCGTPTPTDTIQPVPTSTNTNTPTPTSTPTLVPPRCPGERFTDVCPGDYFYQSVIALNDMGIVSGYNSSPPCDNVLQVPCFKPYNSSSRGQIAKIVSLAAGFSEPVSGQTFQDVSPGSTFYQYIERMASRQIIGGYTCGGPGEPCVPPANRPYFRPTRTVTRGQLAKMVVGAFGFSEPVSGQVFQDVSPGSTFYVYIGRVAARGIIGGYTCGGAGEPCVPPYNRPYYRPNNPVTRGQTTKITYLSMTQPTATATPTSTPTAVSTSTATSTATSTIPATATEEGTATATSTDTAAPTATGTSLAGPSMAPQK